MWILRNICLQPILPTKMFFHRLSGFPIPPHLQASEGGNLSRAGRAAGHDVGAGVPSSGQDAGESHREAGAAEQGQEDLQGDAGHGTEGGEQSPETVAFLPWPGSWRTRPAWPASGRRSSAAGPGN